MSARRTNGLSLIRAAGRRGDFAELERLMESFRIPEPLAKSVFMEAYGLAAPEANPCATS
ncbi:hypothetical protein UFOVP130_65 [uncultured Caudovirales phage]|uniref:Uncharacterized protein n=1 Tax=uncultured Caudovirales phage TaxID=2100421 RepID=A0A6J5LDZ7_9CAUD|nr:hypothetical protein UFOVP130_65 [uncultured Caudovirales phage]